MKRYQGSKKKARRVAFLKRKEKRILKAMAHTNITVQGRESSEELK